MYSVQCTLYSVQYTLYSVHFYFTRMVPVANPLTIHRYALHASTNICIIFTILKNILIRNNYIYINAELSVYMYCTYVYVIYAHRIFGRFLSGFFYKRMYIYSIQLKNFDSPSWIIFNFIFRLYGIKLRI